MNLSQYDSSHFDRGASRGKEVCWWLIRSLFFAPWFPVPSGVKVFWLRVFGAVVGEGVVIRSRVNVTFPWRLKLGDHVWIGEEVLILSLAEVNIGSHVCISQRAILCTGSHDRKSPTFDLITKPIRIEDECWIAAQVFIGPGVTIEAGSVCAAGAVVVNDVGAGRVVGGNPGRVVGG